MEKVAAIVVTYNRVASLAECIAALRSQTRPIDKILVINNGSTDHTEHWLSQQKNIEFFTQKNTGSGGGFYTGIKLAYEKGYDWLWLMDDDGFPKEDALAKLLGNAEEKLCMRNCAVVNKEDKKSFVWKTGNYATIDEVREPIIQNLAHPFNGTLLSKELIQKVGLPKKELFIWGDETEYRYRILVKYKIPYYTRVDSVHYHPACAYSYKNDWDYSSNWKIYFYIRNRFPILKTQLSNKPLLVFPAYICFLLVFLGIIVAFQKTNKFRKICFLLWPVKDALTNNYDATPSLILQKLSFPSGYYLKKPLLHCYKYLKNYVFHPISAVRELKKA
jgi:rhamnopyranosyl-N-acetylglucosaminyl-diphospho-decaprenol beta-1,3/1,4-galactofuranosyltransferase